MTLSVLKVDLSVSNIPVEPELHLQHLGASLLVVRRQEAGQEEGQGAGQEEMQGAGHLLTVMKYQGQNQTDIFAKELRFSPDMFDDHMPWGYGSLFEGESLVFHANLCVPLGIWHPNNTRQEFRLDVLETMADGNYSLGLRDKVKKKMRRLKTKTKDFFRNLG